MKTRIERFLAKVNKTDDCWTWTGARNRPNKHERLRARFYMPPASMAASRAAWILFRGEPGKLYVLHICDNLLCVNPDHLYLGNAKDNARDYLSRSPDALIGENHVVAKLTEKQVIEIRSKYVPYKYSQFKLADEYGVSRSAIQNILNGSNWKHLL